MRWGGVFEDLEAEWAGLERRSAVAEAAELTRAEWSTLTLADRLRGALGTELVLQLAWGERRGMRPSFVGDGWIAGSASDGAGLVVPLPSVATVEGDLSASGVPPSASLVGLPAVLRRIARARAAVTVVGLGGAVLGEGTVDRVGRDHLDLARHAVDEARRRAQVRGTVTVPFSGLGLLSVAPRRGGTV